MLDKPANSPGAAPVPELGPRHLAPDQPRELSREGLSGFISAIRQRRMTLIAVIVLVPSVRLAHVAAGHPALHRHRFADLRTQRLQAAGAGEHRPPGPHDRGDDGQPGGNPAKPAYRPAGRRARQPVRQPRIQCRASAAGFLHRLLSGLRELLGMETEAPPDDPVYGPVQDPARDRTLLAVKDRLHAAPVRFSHVIEVTFVAADPLEAAAAVNNAMDVYIKDQYAAKHRLVDTATELLEKEAARPAPPGAPGRGAHLRLSRRTCHEPGHACRHRQRGNHPPDRGSGQGAVGTCRRERPP